LQLLRTGATEPVKEPALTVPEDDLAGLTGDPLDLGDDAKGRRRLAIHSL